MLEKEILNEKESLKQKYSREELMVMDDGLLKEIYDSLITYTTDTTTTMPTRWYYIDEILKRQNRW